VLQNGRVTATPTSSDRELEHSALRGDIEIIRSYGEEHPNDWTDVLFENEPTVRIVALFAGDTLGAHERALRGLVEHPDRLDVRATTYSRAQLEEFREEVSARARTSDPGAFLSWGVERGRISIAVAADQEQLAETLRARFGDAAELKVGAFAYPMPVESPSDFEARSATSRAEVPLISTLTGAFESDVSVTPGGRWHGPLRLANLGRDVVVLKTNGGLTARVLDPNSGEVVGGFVGFQTMPLVRFVIPPSGALSVPLSVETASFSRRLGYVVPAGDWLMDAVVDIEGVGQRRIPPLSLEIEPPSR
jgi:hypothetical protein